MTSLRDNIKLRSILMSNCSLTGVLNVGLALAKCEILIGLLLL